MGFNKKKWMFYVLIGIIIAAITVFVLFSDYYFIYTVKGRSMEYTLNNNDRILIKKLHGEYYLNRFDIILFQKKDMPKLMIKRLIGLPGENIEIKKDIIFINGKELKQFFLDEVDKREIVKDPKYLTLQKVPPNGFFLIGDNRELSKDSRAFGVIDKKEIIGKVLFSYWPIKAVY